MIVQSQIKYTGLLLLLCMQVYNKVTAQDNHGDGSRTIPEKDMTDLVRSIRKKRVDTTKAAKPPGLAILPSFGYNPSFGFVIGAKASAGKQYGNTAGTKFSSVGFEALYTSKGIITVQAIHNIFTDGNRFNWQGNWQISRFGIVDYGAGTGAGKNRSGSFVLNQYPVHDADSAFPVRYTYIRLNEKLYKKIANNMYAGAGISINMYSNIDDEKYGAGSGTPNHTYSVKHGYNPERYAANGFIAALQYNTLEHPFRAYRGVYADINFRVNQTWIGSSKNAVQVQYDFRKFWSLSASNPSHVLAFWHWASYKLSGDLPYLDMPSTGSDTYKRSGRAYTIGRFRGPNFAYAETEYRFPITKNKLVSGVCFFNLQSASNDLGKRIFTTFDAGAGAGLRILFQKQSRTTLCIDYAKGEYGSSGVFFGLNEVF